MVALVIVVFDEAPDLRFEIGRQVIVFQQYPVLERLMPTLDLALGLRMIFDAPTVRPALSIDQRLALFANFVEPTLQRDVQHKEAPNGSYSAEFIAYVEAI